MPLDTLSWSSIETALFASDCEVCPLIPSKVSPATKEIREALTILQRARSLIVRGFATGTTRGWGNRYCTLGALAKSDAEAFAYSRAQSFPYGDSGYGWSPAGIKAREYLQIATGEKCLWRWNDKSTFLPLGRLRVLRGFNKAILIVQRELDMVAYRTAVVHQ